MNSKFKTFLIVVSFIVISSFLGMAVYNTFFKSDPNEVDGDKSEIVDTSDISYVDDGESKDVGSREDIEVSGGVVDITYNNYNISFGTESNTGGIILNPQIESDNQFLVFINTTQGTIITDGRPEINPYSPEFSDAKYIYCQDIDLIGSDITYIDDNNFGVKWLLPAHVDSGIVNITIIDYTSNKFVGTFKLEVGLSGEVLKILNIYANEINNQNIINKADKILSEDFMIFDSIIRTKVLVEESYGVYPKQIYKPNRWETISKALLNTDNFPLTSVTYSFEDMPSLITLYFEEDNYLGYVIFDIDEIQYNLGIELGEIEDPRGIGFGQIDDLGDTSDISSDFGEPDDTGEIIEVGDLYGIEENLSEDTK